MANRECSRWVNGSACFLIECRIAESCRYWDFDDETNKVFADAIDKHTSRRRRLLDDDGAVQRCEQCNNQDGRSIEFGFDGPFTLAVRGMWAHDAFGQGVCRMVYLCESCFRGILGHAAGQLEPWFDVWTYGLDSECSACRAEQRI